MPFYSKSWGFMGMGAQSVMYFTPRILIFGWHRSGAKSITEFQLDFSHDTPYLEGALGLGHALNPVSILYNELVC